jgi:hypothetical protein
MLRFLIDRGMEYCLSFIIAWGMRSPCWRRIPMLVHDYKSGIELVDDLICQKRADRKRGSCGR